MQPLHPHEHKLQRARQHMETLKDEIERWLGGDPYTVADEFDPERGENVVRLRVLRQPPIRFSVLVGDCLHNLRSALNALAYALAEVGADGPMPEDVARGVEFPIVNSPMTMKSKNSRVGRIRPEAQAIIEGLQPYHRGRDYITHPLWVLHELSRIDRHRLPHLTLFAPEHADITPRNCHITSLTCEHGGYFEDSAVMFRYSAVPDGPGGEMDVKFHFFFDVAFEQGPPSHGLPVYSTLAEIWNFITQETLPPLAPFLPKSI